MTLSGPPPKCGIFHIFLTGSLRDISPIDVEVMRGGGGGDEDIGHVTAETNVETAFYIAPDHFMPRIKSQIISF